MSLRAICQKPLHVIAHVDVDRKVTELHCLLPVGHAGDCGVGNLRCVCHGRILTDCPFAARVEQPARG